jgi:predicted acyl esterase
MKRIFILSPLFILIFSLVSFSQNNNGQLDMLEELGTKYSVNIPTPGGGFLATDVYLPITQDSFVITFNVPIINTPFSAELIPKGTQLIVYPTMFNAQGQEVANPNPYQLPMLMSRTPYDKAGLSSAGYAIPLLGYSFVNQDTRGRFESGGVFIPLYSDSWQKAAYNPHNHLLDISSPTDSANGRFHEDGWLTYQYMLNEFKVPFDLNRDGIIDTIAASCNGTMGLAGASAFAIPNLQLAASRRIDPSSPGLRGMLTLIATLDHYRSTGVHNGVIREKLTYEWLKGQLFDIADSSVVDGDLQNNIHSPSDYGVNTKEEVLELGLTHISSYRYPGAFMANYYPNSLQRAEMDASYAPVDANGNADANGSFSRFSNMQTPNYNLTGWYDIFIDGQINTWKNMRRHLPAPFENRQKLVIGPWAHLTLGTRNSGDLLYPENVGDVLGLSIDLNDSNLINNIDLSKILQIEPLTFLRYTMNANGFVRLGEPVVRIPESQNWQGGSGLQVRIPSSDYDITIAELINFAVGQGSLRNLPIEVNFGFGPFSFDIDIPGIPGLLPIQLSGPIEDPKQVDYDTIPNLRFYVIGPQDSLPQNSGVGNYWMAANDFPLDSTLVQFIPYYLHSNGALNADIPVMNEGDVSYIHNPDFPVLTVGGGNLFVETPDGRNSSGQMNLADSMLIDLTMNHPGVIQFQTDILADTICIVGFPKATLFAKSIPQGSSNGETDTDFFVRIVDVYPDGREFYVIEGAVNARAREYARSIYNGLEDINATFSNIQIGDVYEYQFECLPIAYTFGRGHRMKVLISSSNYPRYQSNPNVPIQPGDFYRRPSGDQSKTYTYLGQTYSARVADNSIMISDQYPSRIELPVMNVLQPTATVNAELEKLNFTLMPNPAISEIIIHTDNSSEYSWRIINAFGQELLHGNFNEKSTQLNIENLAAGLYHLELTDLQKNKKSVAAFVKS